MPIGVRQLDADGDGTQDVSFAAGDKATPIMTVTVTAPNPPDDPTILLNVRVDASWYGVGGTRTANIESFVSNRTGYGG